MKQTGGKYVTVRWGSHGEFKIASKEGGKQKQKMCRIIFCIKM
jgi:hypothetical protein